MSATSNRIYCSFIRASSGLSNFPVEWCWFPFNLIFMSLSTASYRTTTCSTNLDLEADEVDSFEQQIDNLFATSEAQKRKGSTTTKFWDVKTIESDGTFKHIHLSVKEVMKPPNGRKIVLKFNKRLQPVGNEASILSGIFGWLGSDYTKSQSARKTRDRFAPRTRFIINEMFHFDEYSGGAIKRTILILLGRAWKETRNRLYHGYYNSELTIEQNIEGRPPGIMADHWRWYLDYRNSEDTKSKNGV
ncbi:uncharacterized protein LOC130939949 [Arachis stenosperma]|uniref:uncharacterized protein LOC130939949 n=1 Tax=Arachis stenosperma TaxID=217475 RepID=UPI0025AC41BC|nr:uncharacterized protein LOC130939949 [Arachis stenosperma]